MSKRVGTYNSTCKLCHVEGKVEVFSRKPGKVRVTDHIDHAEGCALFKREQPRHLRKKAWRGQEKRANDLVGARETLMSGAVNEDGDGRRFHEWRVESKQTKDRAMIISRAVWRKLVTGAMAAGEEPMLHAQVAGERYVIVRKDWFSAYTDCEPPPPQKQIRSIKICTGMSHAQTIENIDPPGVLMMEAEFKTLKERADEDRREYLRNTPE